MIETFLIILFILLLVHYTLFLLTIYKGLNKLKPKSYKSIPSEFISIIIPFRNEEEYILQTLKSIEDQNYPAEKFEVLFVDDNSTDLSRSIIEQNIKKNNIRVIAVPEDYSANAHKKRAIRFGIENSKGEIIVTTDADCVHSKNWLRNLLSYFDDDTAFISGPVEFILDKNLFSKLQALEFAGLVITGAGLIGSNFPVICNAANIAYRRKAFELVGGFSYQMDLSSGDDELLMQKIFKDSNYRIEFALNKEAIVKTRANKTVSDFYQQRKRWASKGLFYKNTNLILKLILIYLFFLSIPIQLILTFFFNSIFAFTLIISLAVKLLFEYFVLRKGVSLLFNKSLLKPFLLAEIFHIPYIIIAGIAGAFGNFRWKGREIKR